MDGQRLFISHASADQAVVNRIVAYLEERGVPCWISSRDIPPSAIYAEAIVEGIQDCSACAVIVSAAANTSKAVKRELEIASHEDKPFIPIRIDGTEPSAGMAYYLRNTQWVDYRTEGDNGLNRIANPEFAIDPPKHLNGPTKRGTLAWALFGMAVLGTGAVGFAAWPTSVCAQHGT